MSAGLLIPALLLDAALGEPPALWRRVPHPAVLMGRLIGFCDRHFNRGGQRRLKGALCLAVLALLAVGVGLLVQHLPLAPLWEVLAAAILLAQRSLSQHLRAVGTALSLSLPEGRRAVARIVGRDTAALDEAGVVRAAVESAAENLSDGVIAPAFWFLLGGLPGMLLYKLVNTADSMIGHRSPRHEAFGWAAARLDDLLNLIPARLTALLLWLAAGCPAPTHDRASATGTFGVDDTHHAGAPGPSLLQHAINGSSWGRIARWQRVWSALRRDARQHRSPNAGWPEAAMARGLGIALAGPRSYLGRVQAFPWVNGSAERHPGPEAIFRADRLLWRSWALTLAFLAVATLLD